MQPPRPRPGAAVVIDTDAANEIDDPFAIAWALLRADRLDVQACHAAPFSFELWRGQLMRARTAREAPAQASPMDAALLRRHAGTLAHFERQRWDPATVALPALCGPAEGHDRGLEELNTVYRLLGRDPASQVFAGARAFLDSQASPLRPPAATAASDDLIARSAGHTAGDPLWVLAIGCLTNIATALLRDPGLADRMVLVWTAGHSVHAPHRNLAFNLEQDAAATRVVLDSAVPLVYLPGFHIGAQLRLSRPEMERWVQGRGGPGGIGDHLFDLYTHNPLWPLLGITDWLAHSWVIWDLINVAWMLDPSWVPVQPVARPRLDDELRWVARDGADARSAGPMWEAEGIQRDAIFRDFFLALERAPGR